jgi:hypothetical protein
MKLDLGAVRTFLAVVDDGHFTDAADRLGMTQQAVSKRIARHRHVPMEELSGLTAWMPGNARDSETVPRASGHRPGRGFRVPG